MHNPTAGRPYFSTDALPQRDRFPVFYEQIMRFTGLELTVQDRAGFRASAEFQRFGAIQVNYCSNSPLDCVRTPKLVGDGDDTLCLMLLDAGSAYQSQLGSDLELGPGEASICDSGYPGKYNFAADARSWCLKIPRQKLASLLPASTQFAGAKLNRDVTARRLLFGYLRAICELNPGEPATRIYADHIVDLTALALGAQGGARREAEERGVRAARRSAILRAIETRSGDPGLSVVAVAALLGVTPRYVHLLLEETGKSFTSHVLERRLEKAVALLADPRRRDCRIAAIAAEAGFGDLSYFNRAFRRRYGVTPSDAREAVRDA